MKTLFSIFVSIVLTSGTFAQAEYQLFTSQGKKTAFSQLVKSASSNDVVLFGELHDCATAHTLQLKLAEELYKTKGKNLFIGAEMIELHQAEALKRFLANGNIQQLKDSASMWSNFDTDYAPLLVWSQTNGVNYIATNVTRKYASLIFKKGLTALDSLPENEKAFMCPIPFPFDSTLSQYQELIEMGKEMHGSGIDFALAQALKDATMAYSISEELNGENTCLHLNGSFHSDYHQGIMWYLEQYRKGTKVLTITTVTQKSLKSLNKEYKGKADYILVVPEYGDE
jgi:uncharacterized iron-regulated protein